MKFKRLLCLLLPAMLLGCLAACGESTPDADTQPPSQTDPADKTEQPSAPEYIEGLEVITKEDMQKFDESVVRLFGRTYKSGKQLVFDNAGTGAEFTFYGTEFEAKIISSGDLLLARVFVDGEETGSLMEFRRGFRKFDYLAQDLTEGVHTVKIIKATSSQNGVLSLSEIRTNGKLLRPKQKTPLKIEFVGDSITVGAGVFAPASQDPTIENSDATKGYAYLTAEALGADCSLVATEGICTKVKWVLPVSMCDMYLSKSSVTTAAYDFPETAQDVIVVALGTNDSYYMGTDASYTSDAFSADYKELITLVRSKNATAKIVCIYGMMGTHAPVAQGIQKAIADLDDANVSYFAMPAGTDGAGSHPSAQNAVAQSAALTAYLKELLGTLSF
ncbi:MAG: hypothetical protein K2J30_02180 [Clostridia bacterium]|nr:hypothetical protein [Clostridia bacterium]